MYICMYSIFYWLLVSQSGSVPSTDFSNDKCRSFCKDRSFRSLFNMDSSEILRTPRKGLGANSSFCPCLPSQVPLAACARWCSFPVLDNSLRSYANAVPCWCCKGFSVTVLRMLRFSLPQYKGSQFFISSRPSKGKSSDSSLSRRSAPSIHRIGGGSGLPGTRTENPLEAESLSGSNLNVPTPRGWGLPMDALLGNEDTGSTRNELGPRDTM